MTFKHFHNEFDEFVLDIDHLYIQQTKNGADEIWIKIISDVHKYVECKNYSWLHGDTPVHNFSIKQSERPDIIYECADYIMGIECFQFDASKRTRKGSKQKQKESEVKRTINEIYYRSSVVDSHPISIEKHVDVDFSINNYFESLISSFREHANSITEYRQNLIEKASGKKVMLSFFVEDTTALGNFVIANEKKEPLDPLKIPFFLGELALTQGLDYVIIKTTNNYITSLRIQNISTPALKELLGNCYGPKDKYVQYQYKLTSHFV